MNRRLGLATLVALACWVSVASRAEAQSWTVLVYMAADNNLEPAAVQNVAEMLEETRVGAEGVPVRVLLQVDRSEQWTRAPLPTAERFRGVRRFEIVAGHLEPRGDLGVVDMTSPAVLADFVRFGLATAPAEHVAFISWDHGAAWLGANSDEHGGRAITPAPDLIEGLAAALGDARLALLGFDACLMSNYDALAKMAELADVLVVSEEVELDSGWDYRAFLGALADDPAISGAAVGQRIAQTYAARSAEDDPMYTIAVLDAEAMRTRLTPAVHAFAEALQDALADERSARAVARARAAADGFGREGNDDQFEVVDLAQLAAAVAAAGVATEQAQGVTAALEHVVSVHETGRAHAGVGGVSIYVPAQKAAPEYLALPDASDAPWGRFVSAYSAFAERDTTAPTLSGLAVAQDDQGNDVLTGATSGDDIDDLHVVLAQMADDGTSAVLLGAMPIDQAGGADDAFEGGEVRYAFAGAWPMLTDGTHTTTAPFFGLDDYTDEHGAAHEIVALEAELDDGGGGGFAMGVLVFDLDPATHSGDFIAAFDVDPESGATAELDLGLPASRVRLPLILVRVDGEYDVAPGELELAGAHLAIRPGQLDAGGYSVGLSVTDVFGNRATALVPADFSGTRPNAGGRSASESPPAGPWRAAVFLATLCVVVAALGAAVVGVVFLRRAARRNRNPK